MVTCKNISLFRKDNIFGLCYFFAQDTYKKGMNEILSDWSESKSVWDIKIFTPFAKFNW